MLVAQSKIIYLKPPKLGYLGRNYRDSSLDNDESIVLFEHMLNVGCKSSDNSVSFRPYKSGYLTSSYKRSAPRATHTQNKHQSSCHVLRVFHFPHCSHLSSHLLKPVTRQHTGEAVGVDVSSPSSVGGVVGDSEGAAVSDGEGVI